MKNYMKYWVCKLLFYQYFIFNWLKINQATNWLKFKNIYDKISMRRNFCTANLFLRRNFRTAKYPYCKISYGEISLRRNFLPANFLYGEIFGHGVTDKRFENFQALKRIQTSKLYKKYMIFWQCSSNGIEYDQTN